MEQLTREQFEQEVDNANINSKELFDIVNNFLSKNTDTISISIQDLIDYANIRYELWEFPKVIYYCHYWLTQSPSKEEIKKILNITLSSIQQMLDNRRISESVRINENKIEGNTNQLMNLITSTKIDSVILTSYSARKQSSMPQISQEDYNNIYTNYTTRFDEWELYWAFNEIFFLFSDSYLKKKISHNHNLLLEFEQLCTQWLLKL